MSAPNVFVAEIGQEVEVYEKPGPKLTLMYHVPQKMRGTYTPQLLANYDSSKEYRTDKSGLMLCAESSATTGELCRRTAINRSPFCGAHGGALHPLDKEPEDNINPNLFRYYQYRKGEITVEDLDDQELASGSFRSPVNGRLYRPPNTPRSMITDFHKAIYARANDIMRSNLVKATEILAEIAFNKANEPADRIKAANIILERGLGKTPQVVAITADTQAWEEVFDGLARTTREESRANRGIIDAEVLAIEPVPLSEQLDDKDRNLIKTLMAEPKTVEIKEFEYNLNPDNPIAQDNSEIINKARKKRYVAKALGVPLEDLDEGASGVPYQIKLIPIGGGQAKVKFIDPDDIKVPRTVLNREKKARNFSRDFD